MGPSDTALVDVVDNQDRPIASAPPAEVLKHGGNFRTVHVFVWNGAGQLMLRRLGESTRHPGRWGSSVSSHVASGEDYAAAAQRLAREQLGSDLQLGRMGKLTIRDTNSMKFVMLFRADAEAPAEGDANQTATEIRYWSKDEVRNAIANEPDSFTPTFAELFTTYYP